MSSVCSMAVLYWVVVLCTVVQGSSVYKVPRRSPPELPPAPPPRSPLQPPWVADALSEAIGRFIPQGGSADCRRHAQLYRESLDNLTLWAVQMHDSSATSAVGLLPGNSYQLGHYDSCTSLSVPSLQLSGRYCLADIQFWPGPDIYPGFQSPHPASKFVPPDNRLSVWERLRMNSDLSHRRREVLHWAVCVPASCDAEVVATSLNLALHNSVPGLGFNVSLSPHRCHAKTDERPPSLGFYIVWMIIAVAILIAFVATGMDFFIYQPGRNHNRSVRRWLRPFSMYKNMSKLVTPNANSEFAEFHVYKLIAILFVISGHRQMYAIGQTPLYNVDWVEEFRALGSVGYVPHASSVAEIERESRKHAMGS
ncbi:uncharacterized protein LOC124358547 [Homalodisca vitripennis]|uniref:uncharacterized protein LOC124358547 n=1 Tax=Homalodisca vitripennis TaxID=197043 RepID=UPI001EEADC9A|nr:uncharacterized protein LOC124358547 [Homalodisca vitripennis]